MVLMNIVGVTPPSLSVTCSADNQIPNIDIVFVLDVTGSMDDCPGRELQQLAGGEQKKIVSLRVRVKDFYSTNGDGDGRQHHLACPLRLRALQPGGERQGPVSRPAPTRARANWR
jgi:hypothetical protein